jgi:tetratricopeptide (TPR) repeat protein
MKSLAFCLLLLAVFLLACAGPSHYRRGHSALEKEEYEKALAELRQAVKENPLITEAVRDLGIVLYEMKNYKNAALILEKALQRQPNDGTTRVYLGAACEAFGRLDEVIKIYRAFPNVDNLDDREELCARLNMAIQAKLRLEARQALAQESSLDPQSFPEKSVTVLNFRNLGGNFGFDPLAKGLADMVITDLSQVQALTVIERSRMQALTEEMGLGQSGLVDEQTAPRIGQLLGVKKVLQGSFLDLDSRRLRLDANLSDVAAKNSKALDETSGEIARFFRLEKNLVFKVIAELGITLTEAEEKAIRSIPTENLLAFLAYSRGLDARDRGDFAKAREEFQQAVKIDPQFEAAKTQLEETTAMQMYGQAKPSSMRRLARSQMLTLQPRQLRLARSAFSSNPAFGFVNRGRIEMLSQVEMRADAKTLRQPGLEGRTSFGLKGDLVITVQLP